MTTLTICLLSTLLLQNPPAGQTGNQNNNKGGSGVFNPGTPPGPGRMPPDKDGGNRQPIPPIGGPNGPVNQPGGNYPPGGNYQVMADGTYAVLAYEKFGQPLPGMPGIKVVIRNNILTFPGDAKNPGKMMLLTFGPANTVIVTPLDGTRPVNTNPNSPWADNTNRNNGNAQQGNLLPQPQGETGVYVLSSEYFAISIISNQVITTPGNIPPGTTTGTNVPPGDPTRNATGSGTGTTPGGEAARRATGSGTGGTPGGNAARQATGSGTAGNDPARAASGGNTQGGTLPPGNMQGDNNVFNPRQPDPRLPQPGPSSAILVLKKVAQ